MDVNNNFQTFSRKTFLHIRLAMVLSEAGGSALHCTSAPHPTHLDHPSLLLAASYKTGNWLREAPWCNGNNIIPKLSLVCIPSVLGLRKKGGWGPKQTLKERQP